MIEKPSFFQPEPSRCVHLKTEAQSKPFLSSDLAWAWLLIIACTLFRLWYSGRFLLVPDETNYWQWGRYLDWGYHDQAPLIGWLIRLSTEWLGDNETAVRLPSVLSSLIVSVYSLCFAKRWFGDKAVLAVAVMSQSILLFQVGGLLATPDGIQAAAWAAACWHGAKAYEKGEWGQWLLTGFWFGIGMLAKFTMVLFAVSIFIYGLTTLRHRQRLMEIRPYVGFLLGMILFCPVILWNARHGWNSVRHVAFIGGANEARFFQPHFLGDFIGSQAALLTPIIFILVVMAWVHVARHRFDETHWTERYLWFASAPTILFFAALSLHTRIYGNWPAAGYIGAILLVAYLYGPGGSASVRNRLFAGRRLWPWAIGLSYAVSALVLLQVVRPVLPLPASMDRISGETLGWDQLGQVVGKTVRTMPNPEKTFVFGLSYQVASELAFYVPSQPATVSINRWERPNVYDYWWEDADLIGWDGVGVTYDPVSHETRLNEVFERVDPPEEVVVYRKPALGEKAAVEVKRFYIYKAYGFKGGLRWVPTDPGDIRTSGLPETVLPPQKEPEDSRNAPLPLEKESELQMQESSAQPSNPSSP